MNYQWVIDQDAAYLLSQKKGFRGTLQLELVVDVRRSCFGIVNGLSPAHKTKPFVQRQIWDNVMKHTTTTVSILVLAAACSCCVSVGSQQLTGTQTPQTKGPILEHHNPRYILQRQDVVSLTFPLSPEINQVLTIQPDGYLNLQGAGSIYAQGLTAPELVVAIKNAYSGILRDPIVNVDIQDYQKSLFTVTGQVAKPGQYELRANITVVEALAVAGGMTMTTAKTQVFLFHRSSPDWFEVKRINLKDVLHGKNVNEDPTLQPGDMIYVPENRISVFRKYVPYSFNAGTYLSPP